MDLTMQTPLGEDTYQRISCITGISSDTIKGSTSHPCGSVSPKNMSITDEWVSEMFLECNIPARAHNIMFEFLYIDLSGCCIWPHGRWPLFPNVTGLSNSLILCCRTTDRDSDFVWVMDIILKCGVSKWHLPFLERQSIFAASALPPFLKMLEFKPTQVIPEITGKSYPRYHTTSADKNVCMYMYKRESLFRPIKLNRMFRYIPQSSSQIQFASYKEFICTSQHPLLKLHQEGQLMPLISRLCDSGALREDISGDTDEDTLHLYSYQKNGPGQVSADVDLAKMFRGLILDKRVYPPKIVCLPLLAFDTVKRDPVSSLRFLRREEQILEASVKMDGTSIVMTCYQGRLIVATKNRFKSLRSDLVKAILYVRNITESAFQENYTYICEYVGGPNCRAIEYDYEDICLLAVVDNLTGVELDYERKRSIADSLGFITPATVYFNSTSIHSFVDITDCFSEIYGTIEGVVVRTANGRRVKMKTHEWESTARALYSVSPLSVWASKLRSTSLSWDSSSDEEHLLYTEISKWLLERANDMLRFLKPKSERKSKSNSYSKGRISLSDFLGMTIADIHESHLHKSDLHKPDLHKPDLHKPDPYDIYISDCLIFDVPKSRSAYRLHSRIVRDSANHGMQLCNNISACSTCIAVWFFLKPYNNYVDWESFNMLYKDRIRIVLEDDWHHLDTSQELNIQWIRNSHVTDSIFQYMDHKTLSMCRRVCRHWHLYINQNFEDVISSSFCDAVKSRNSRLNVSRYRPARFYLEYDYDSY